MISRGLTLQASHRPILVSGVPVLRATHVGKVEHPGGIFFLRNLFSRHGRDVLWAARGSSIL